MISLMRHRIGLAVVVWLLAIDWTTSSWALSAVPRTFAELVGFADWVLTGTVTQVTSAVEAKGTRIYTYVTLADLEVIKGGWHDSEYVLRVSGGVVDQRGEVYSGFPQFKAGRRYILFIQGNFSALFSGSAGIGRAHLAQPLNTWLRDCRSQPRPFPPRFDSPLMAACAVQEMQGDMA
jgi:hypothetical protein